MIFLYTKTKELTIGFINNMNIPNEILTVAIRESATLQKFILDTVLSEPDLLAEIFDSSNRIKNKILNLLRQVDSNKIARIKELRELSSRDSEIFQFCISKIKSDYGVDSNLLSYTFSNKIGLAAAKVLVEKYFMFDIQ